MRISLTLDAFTARYGLARTSIYKLISQGKIRAVKCGRRTLIDAASADAWFTTLPAAEINCHFPAPKSGAVS